MAQSDTCKEKFKDYNCDEGLEEIHVWFCYHIWSFYGKEILEEREELSVDAIFAQAALSSNEANGRNIKRFVLPKLVPILCSQRKRSFQKVLTWTLSMAICFQMRPFPNMKIPQIQHWNK